jgi:uncharacterized metal-binding protein
MPSGATHDQITLTCLPLVGGIALLASRSASITLSLTGSFLFSGLMFGPDLDIYSVQFKRWGFLRWIWRPYQKGLRHRSWLSHGPIVGTVLRLLYLSLWAAFLGAIAFCIGVANHWTVWDWQSIVSVRDNTLRFGFQFSWEVGAALVGLELGAMSHSFSDSLGSAWGRLWNRKRNGRSRFRP